VSPETWFRRFLMAAAAATYPAAVAELVFVDHYEEALQIVPFVLIGLGLAALAWAWVAPSRASLNVLRAVAIVVALGSLVGIWLHARANWAFAAEVDAQAGTGDLLWAAMSGHDPLLAPGMIALAALLAAAATYRHPAFGGTTA